jgi:hypothetical protein
MPTRTRKPSSRSAPLRSPRPAQAADKVIRGQLLYLLKGGGAHIGFEKAIRGWPPELRGARPNGLPYSAWELLEHLRIAQWDILEFSRNPKHRSPEWPSGYWPATEAPPSKGAWEGSIRRFEADLKAMQDMIRQPSTDLYAPIPHGDGQTILREALLVADHNAYHLGQLVMLRRLLGIWQEA